MRIENWPWLYKLQLLLIAGLVMLVADALMSGILLAFGVTVDLAFSAMSGFMCLVGTVPFLWTARPRCSRHLFILCGIVFAATAVALSTLALAYYGIGTEGLNYHEERGLLVALPVLAVFGMWGLIYWLAPRDTIWEKTPDEDVAD